MTHTNPRFVRPLAMVLGLVALTGCGAFPGLEIRVGGEKDEYEQAARHPTQPPPTYVSQPPPPYTTQPVGYPPPAYQPPVCSHCLDFSRCSKRGQCLSRKENRILQNSIF